MSKAQHAWHRPSAVFAAAVALLTLPLGSAAQYSLGDSPIAWTDEGLLFFRGHVWVWDTSTSNNEAFDVSCPESGLYTLGPDGSVTGVFTGDLVCDFMFYPEWNLSEDGRSLLVRHQQGKDDIWGAISRVDLQERRVQVFALGEGIDYNTPVWVGPGRWAFFEPHPGGVLRITDSDPEVSRVLAGPPELRGGYIEAYDRERGDFRIRRHEFPYPRGTPRSLVTTVDTLGNLVEEEREVPLSEFGWQRRGDVVAYVRDMREPSEYHERRRLPEDWGIAVRDLTTGQETVLFSTEGENAYEMGHSPAHLFGSFRDGTPHLPLLWSPDGSHIVFPRSFEGGTTLWSIPVQGGAAVQLTFRDEASAPLPPGR